jgi:hypothetical protein
MVSRSTLRAGPFTFGDERLEARCVGPDESPRCHPPPRGAGQPPQPNYTGNGRADAASSPVRLFPAGDSGRGTVGVARGPGGVRHTAHGAPPGLRPSPWPGAGDSPLREPTPLDRTTGPCATLDVMALTERQGAPSLSVAEPSKPTRPPAHLRAATRRWFASVLEDYDLEPHHVRLLQLAGEAWDRGQGAREALKRDGVPCPGRTSTSPSG